MTTRLHGVPTLALAALLVAATLAGPGVASTDPTSDAEPPRLSDPPGVADHRQADGLDRFDDREAFVRYVQRGRSLAAARARAGLGRSPRGRPRVDLTVRTTEAGAPADASTPRVSGTNVQETGIDEPDAVKTDGEYAFYTRRAAGRPVPLPGPRATVGTVAPPRVAPGRTYVLSTADPADPEVVANVSATGDLLLAGDRLLVLGSEAVTAYDVSDADDPERAWSRSLDGSVVTARQHDGRVYLVTRTSVSATDPCPVQPLEGADRVACTDVYRPSEPVPVDGVNAVHALDPATGEVSDTVGFVGNAGASVYASTEGLYVTYRAPADASAVRLSFLLSTQRDRLSAPTVRRLETLRSYDLSPESTLIETRATVERWLGTLDDDRRTEARESMREEYADYLAKRQRGLVRTGVVRVETRGDRLDVAAAGEVPGRPLNQFAFDEHEGTLRVATTVPGVRDARSRNDLYTLDAGSLTVEGSVRDMAPGQRVFAARYVEETAYVVTFRRVDPFHVVDLSDPSDPEELGQVRLPGVSTYLHPVDGDHVLGVGRGNGSAKVTLFDVSDPTEPTVADEQSLDDGWSAVAEGHHAFLLDRRHGVAFVPGSSGGHVLDYTGGELSVETVVRTDRPATRARYVGDSLYVFAGEEVVVVDERTWTETARVTV